MQRWVRLSLKFQNPIAILTAWPQTSAAEEIVLRIREDGRQRGFRFVENPTTGALEIPAHMRAEIADALVAHVRSLHLPLYLLQAQLYLDALWLKGLGATQRVVGYLKRKLL